MMRSGNGLANRAVACVCSVVLAAGLVPAPALAADVQAARIDAQAIEERAAQIDALAAANAEAFEDGSIIVVYREGALESRRADAGIATQSVTTEGIEGARATVISEDAGVNGGGAALHVDVPEGSTVGRAVAAAEADPDVVLAQPNFRYHLLDEMPNDPVLANTANNANEANQWWIPAVNAPAAWQIAHADHQVAVAVLDTGINFEHPDLKNNILADYAYESHSKTKLTESPYSDEMSHGSHVAGIVAAEADNAQGIAGVSYNANILPIAVFHLEYSQYYGQEKAACSDEDLIAAYDYLLSDDDGNGKTVAQETNTRVVNMSLGGYLSDSLAMGESLEDAYDYAFEKKIQQAQEQGILTCAAAGNGDEGGARTDASYPSDYPDVMSVTALQSETERAYFSDYNENKNIAAPGVDIYSTYYHDDTYAFMSGTSMACPLVAGCAALLFAYDSSLSVADVKQVLYSTADDLGDKGFDPYFGWGRVNIGKALKSIGTASVKAERSTMMRASRQQMSATSIAAPDEAHAWKWDVFEQDGETATAKASVDEHGTLTAREAGTVKVRATATDVVGGGLSGQRTITISEIEIDGGVAASANPSENTVAVRWKPAEGAAHYRILRSEKSPTEGVDADFAQLADTPAADITSGEWATYIDTAAQPSTPYWYRVVPIGELDGSDVVGAASTSARCYFADKVALKAAVDEAGNLLNSTVTSADGADVPATEQWVTPATRSALNRSRSTALTAYRKGDILQADVDAAASSLEGSIATFKGARKAGSKLAANTLKASAKAPAAHVFGYSASARKIAASSAYAVSGAKGTVAYQLVSGDKRISVNLSNGDITVPAAMPVGTYPLTVRVTAAGGSGYASGVADVALSVKVSKIANTLSAKAKSPSASAKKLKKKAQTIAAKKAVTVSGAQGPVTYKKVSGNSKIKVASNGTFTLKKGLKKKSSYPVKIAVTAAGDATHEPATKSVTVKVKVK